MKFCARHDSHTVVAGAKFRCDQLSTFQTRALQILVEFRIWLKYRKWAPGISLVMLIVSPGHQQP